MKECLAADCKRDARAKGLCSMHYSRFRLHGDCTVVLKVQGQYKECIIDRCHNKMHRNDKCIEHYGWGERTHAD